MSVNLRGRNIFIVSGGREAVPIIMQAREMGLGVAVSDGDEGAPGFRHADEVMIASTYDHERTRDLALELNRRMRIHGVMAAAADVPVTVAAVADALGLSGPSLDAARISTDKFLMKSVFRAAGIPVPWFDLVRGPEHLEHIVREKKEPLVVKPVDSRGARGVVRLLEGVDIEWAYGEAMRHSPSRRVMVEGWVQGRQISTESIVTEEGVVTPGLSDRNYHYLERFAPYVIEDGGDLPAALTGQEREEIDELVWRIAGSLSVERATIKGDIVIGEKGPVVIEAALRLSGGYFCSHTIPLSTGSNIVEAAILMALGEEIDLDDYVPSLRRYVCQRFLFPEPGVVREVRLSQDIVKGDGDIAMAEIYVREGDVLRDVTSHPCRAGTVTVTGPTRETARERMEGVLAGISIVTERVPSLAFTAEGAREEVTTGGHYCPVKFTSSSVEPNAEK